MDVGCQWGVGFGVGVRGVAALRSGGCWRRGAAVNDNAAVAVATAMMLRRSPVRSEDSDRNRGGEGGFYGGYGMRTTGETVPPRPHGCGFSLTLLRVLAFGMAGVKFRKFTQAGSLGTQRFWGFGAPLWDRAPGLLLGCIRAARCCSGAAAM